MIDKAASGQIIVVGSANIDFIITVPRAPARGETILATGMQKLAGGKGANQAVAAARLRGNVSFIGCVGDDADGTFLLRQLRVDGVDTSNVEIISRGRTGLAVVNVYDSGENSITVVPGTNYAFTAARVQMSIATLAANDPRAIVVTQAEVLTEVTIAAVRAAEAAKARAILNLAPYQPMPLDVLALCDPLVVNESEVSSLVGWSVQTPDAAMQAAGDLIDVVRSVVVTIGEHGAVWVDRSSRGHVRVPRTQKVVDTTGAGDAFVGAVAAMLARGSSLEEAVEVGVRGGTFAVGRSGAQASYPTMSDLQIDMNDINLGNEQLLNGVTARVTE